MKNLFLFPLLLLSLNNLANSNQILVTKDNDLECLKKDYYCKEDGNCCSGKCYYEPSLEEKRCIKNVHRLNLIV